VLASECLGRKDAEERVLDSLRAYGVSASKTRLLNGEELELRFRGAPAHRRTTFAELVAGTRATGVVPEIDRMRWRDKDPYGTISGAMDSSGLPPIVLSAGPRTSAPFRGPGYVTNSVVGDMLDDVLYYREEVARLSYLTAEDSFRPAFRAFRAYLGSCITTLDAFLNRCAWFGLNDPPRTFTPDEEKTLRKQRVPLDVKFQQWLPILCGGQRLAETSRAWTDYRALRVARNGFVHVNEPDHMFVLRDAATVLNLCRRGVGELLIACAALLGRPPLPTVFAVRFAREAAFVEKTRPS
jgi:hypothetical protein